MLGRNMLPFIIASLAELIGAAALGCPVETNEGISVRARAISLKDVLAEVTKLSGAQHKASREVEDIRVSLFARNRTAAEIRGALSGFLHHTWEPVPDAKSGAPSFRL